MHRIRLWVLGILFSGLHVYILLTLIVICSKYGMERVETGGGEPLFLSVASGMVQVLIQPGLFLSKICMQKDAGLLFAANSVLWGFAGAWIFNVLWRRKKNRPQRQDLSLTPRATP